MSSYTFQTEHTVLSPYGYDLIMDGDEQKGTRYCWNCSFSSHFVESAAFMSRTVLPTALEDFRVSAYTTSVSAGCILSEMNKMCSFCRTGNLLPYTGKLAAFDIALQNVFMVLADSKNNGRLTQNNKREFAYMGQGEPGFSYPQVSDAILLTDCAMRLKNQVTHRHIFATSGVSDGLSRLIRDTKDGRFDGIPITLHYSLHTTEAREKLMPIDTVDNYRQILALCRQYAELTGNKVCLGILLFSNFQPKGKDWTFSTSFKLLQKMADEIDPALFRVSICDLNNSDDVGRSSQLQLTTEQINEIREIFDSYGIENKFFYSFGKKENSACGLLASNQPKFRTNHDHFECFREAVDLLNQYRDRL